MSNLANLARAGQLAAEPTSPGEIAALLKGAGDQLRDAGVASLSAVSRFMLAYNATHALAFAALRAEGYRPSASQGHRKVIFQVLDATAGADRKSTRLNSSHLGISYAVFCLKKKKKNDN